MTSPILENHICEFIIIVGGPASGKTLNKDALMKHFNCRAAFDLPGEEALVCDSKESRILILTHDENVEDPRGPFPRRKERLEGIRIPVATAAAALGARWIIPMLGWCPDSTSVPLVKGVVFPRNPERDAAGNAVLYPGARNYEGVAGCFRSKDLQMEVVILAPTAEALEAWVKLHDVVDELDRAACRVTKLEPLR